MMRSRTFQTVFVSTAVVGIVFVLTFTGYLTIWRQWQRSRAVGAVLQSLNNPDSNKTWEALAAARQVRALDATVAALVEVLEDTKAAHRRRAVEGLRHLGPEARLAVPALIGGLSDKDFWVAHDAIDALAAIGPDAKTALPNLIDALEKDRLPNSWPNYPRAEEIIKQIDLEGGVEALGAVVRDERERIDKRRFVLHMLSSLGPDGQAAVPDVVESLVYNNPLIRLDAIDVLGQMGSAARSATPVLIQLLYHPDPQVRGRAARVLGRIGPEARTGIPSLVESLIDEGEYSPGPPGPRGTVRVGDEAASSLARIGEPAALALLEASESKHPAIRGRALRALQELGAEGGAAPQILVGMLNAEDVTLRQRAAGALVRLAADDSRAILALTKALDSKDDEVRRMAALKFVELAAQPEVRPRLERAVPALRTALGDTDWRIRSIAQQALKAIESESPVRAGIQ